MKTKLLLLGSALSLCVGAMAQGPHCSVRATNNSLTPVSLKVAPWDPSVLLQINESFNGQTIQFDYWLEDVTSGQPLPFLLPSISDFSDRPAFLSNGVLVAGDGLNTGQELHYFDGSNVTTFDLNPGAIASDPKIQVFGDNVYIIATDSTNARVLYFFDEPSIQLERISSLSSADVTSVAGEVNDTVYYTMKHLDNGESIYQLLKSYKHSNGYYVHGVQVGVGEVEPSNYFYQWSQPLHKWGETFIVESRLSNGVGVMDSVEQRIRILGASAYAGFEEQKLPAGQIYELRMIDHGDKIYVYRAGGDTVRSYQEYVSGLAVQAQFVGVSLSSTLREHFVAEDDRIFFIGLKPNYTDELLAFNTGTFSPIVTGEHIHRLYEKNHTVYLSKTEYSAIDSSALILYHTHWDMLEVLPIEPADHPPVNEAGLFYENKFTFLFTPYGSGTNNVYQLESYDALGMEELKVKPRPPYPNPLFAGEDLMVVVAFDGTLELLNSAGETVRRVPMTSGDNLLSTEGLPSGIYLLRFGKDTYRVTVL